MMLKKLALGLVICLSFNTLSVVDVFADYNIITKNASLNDGTVMKIGIGSKHYQGGWIDQEIMLSQFDLKSGRTYSVSSDNSKIVTCKLGRSIELYDDKVTVLWDEPSIKLTGVSVGTTTVRMYEKYNGKFTEVGRCIVKVESAEDSIIVNERDWNIVNISFMEDHKKAGHTYTTYSTGKCYTTGTYIETLPAGSLLENAVYTCKSNKTGVSCEIKLDSEGKLKNYINITEMGEYTLTYYQTYDSKTTKYFEKNISVKPIQINKDVYLFKGEALPRAAVIGHVPDWTCSGVSLYFTSDEQPYTNVYGALNSPDLYWGNFYDGDEKNVTEIVKDYTVTFSNGTFVGMNCGTVTLKCYLAPKVPDSQKAEKGQYIGDVTLHVVPFPEGSPNA